MFCREMLHGTCSICKIVSLARSKWILLAVVAAAGAGFCVGAAVIALIQMPSADESPNVDSDFDTPAVDLAKRILGWGSVWASGSTSKSEWPPRAEHPPACWIYF